MRILRIGDPHVKVSNIDESERLVEFVADLAMKQNVQRIEILGDLFHTHAILRLEVLEFWTWALELLSDVCEVVVLVGNHDQTGDYNSHSSALDIFQKLRRKNLHIIDAPRAMGCFGYMPYTHDSARFIELANALNQSGAKTLVCHQTFSGSKYENGFYAPDGIDPESVSFELIISGHIHAFQKFGKIIYPGTPRWDSISDANQPKGVWVYSHDDISGAILSEEFFTSEHVCRPILSFTYREGDTTIPIWNEGARVALELVGSSGWVSLEKQRFKGKCSIKTKITDQKRLESRKSGNNLEFFLKNLYHSTVDKENLLKVAKEYGIV